MKNSRICMVGSHFYPTVGGAEKQAESLAKELKKSRHSVFVLTQKIKGLKSIEVRSGIKIYRKIFAPHFSFLFGIFYLIATFIFLWLKRKEYDIIHCHILFLHTVSAVIIGKLFHKKVIVKIACTREIGDIARMQNIRGAKVLLRICKKVDRFIAVSKEAIKELKDIGIRDEQIVFIPNFVDIKKFYSVSNEKKIKLKEKLFLSLDKKIVTFIGRLTPQKGISYLIEAWNKVITEYPLAILLIIGGGVLFESLKRQVKDSGLSGKVKFMGEIDSSYVSEYLQASDIFVLPSISEGLPGTLLEAMACGLPSAVTRIGGNVDLIEDGKNGFLVEPENSKELTASISRLLSDEKTAAIFGRQARQKIKARYSKNVLVSKYEELYRGF